MNAPVLLWNEKLLLLQAANDTAALYEGECCCGCCGEWPSQLDIEVTDNGACSITWNLPTWNAGVAGYEESDCPTAVHGWQNEAPTESGGDLNVIWDQGFCIWCEDGQYYLRMSGRIQDGYDTPITCGPHAATYTKCSPREDWKLIFVFTCGGCELTIEAVPSAGTSWNSAAADVPPQLMLMMGAGDPPKRTATRLSDSSPERPKRSLADVVDLMEICLKCDQYPCLAAPACAHRDAVKLLSNICPLDRWPSQEQLLAARDRSENTPVNLTPRQQERLARRQKLIERRERRNQPIDSRSASVLDNVKLLCDAAAQEYPYPANFLGKGIVIPGGGPKYFPMAYVLMKLLRHLECQLPIEIWHLPGEMSAQMIRLANDVPGVRTVDAGNFPRPRILNGWELKPFAIINSDFEEVLLIDADNVPSRDPTYLFYDPEYARTGARFWPDIVNSNALFAAQDVWNLAQIDKEHRRLPAFESGQVLINKSRCWKPLQVTMHINEHSDFWYKAVYGDKDTFLIAWQKCGADYAINDSATWNRPAIIQSDHLGQPLFYHCCQGKHQLIIGQKIRVIPEPVRSFVANEAKQLDSNLGINWHDCTRADFERECREGAVSIDLADHVVITRIMNGPVLHCIAGDVGFTPHLRSDGFWEAWISVFIARLLQPGWICADIGAHVGYYTTLMCHLGAEKVIAFEPRAKCAQMLARSCLENAHNVEIFKAAAWDDNGDLQLFSKKRDFLVSCVTDEGRNGTFEPDESVQAIKLDVALAGEERVDFVKIDAEGSEEHIWRGMQKTIARLDPRILMEFESRREFSARFIDELATRYPLRVVDFDGRLQPTTAEQLRRSANGTMLYLSNHD